MKKQLKRYALFALVVAVDLFLRWKYPVQGGLAVKGALDYLVEMLLFIPPIFVLVGLLDVWVPRQIVEKNVGPDSGLRGVIISILVATAAAGPLYAGFPVADALLKKGCRLANAVIFLGTWATIKIPMLMMEIKFVGLPFALFRLVLTLPAIIVTGYLMEMILEVREKGRFARSINE
ncbi:MAG TPA: permease [Desulfotomaculum sp.]|nr:permease [Desulfotomaculum sp.]